MVNNDTGPEQHDGRLDRLTAEARQGHVLYSHAINSRNSILATGQMCSLMLKDDFTIATMTNAQAILGPLDVGVPIVDALQTGSAREYFTSFRRLGHELEIAAEKAEGQPWKQVFPDVVSPMALFEDWVSVPPGSWNIRDREAELVAGAIPGSEHYLVSSTELIPARHDFRIEYVARAETDPRDLSLVVGTRIDPGVHGVFGDRPDTQGYTFAFGAIENRSTELQRRLETIARSPGRLITPAQDHHCVAERVGGQLRFSVDDTRAYETVDCLPLIDEGHGHVGLYTCGPKHTFRELSISVRPTCLSPDICKQIETLRSAVLELQTGPARLAEVHYLGKNLFLFRDVSK